LPGNRAFITHWPAKSDNRQLKLAIKDNIDMEGVVTTAGSEYFAKDARARKEGCCVPGNRPRERRAHCGQDEPDRIRSLPVRLERLFRNAQKSIQLHAGSDSGRFLVRLRRCGG
jgi:hypothetical protein